MKLNALLSISFALLLISTTAFANAKSLLQNYIAQTTDEQTRPFMVYALKNVHNVECENGQHCSKATEEEFSNPPLSVNQMKGAIAHGGVGAMALWCGLDSKRTLLAMLGYGKHVEKMSDRNLQLMSLINGAFQGSQLRSLKKLGECPPEIKERVDREMPVLKK